MHLPCPSPSRSEFAARRKQLFIAMVSVCLMLAADRSNVVISTYEGALRTSAQACMAGQVITIICNLLLVSPPGHGMQRQAARPLPAPLLPGRSHIVQHNAAPRPP